MATIVAGLIPNDDPVDKFNNMHPSVEPSDLCLLVL